MYKGAADTKLLPQHIDDHHHLPSGRPARLPPPDCRRRPATAATALTSPKLGACNGGHGKHKHTFLNLTFKATKIVR